MSSFRLVTYFVPIHVLFLWPLLHQAICPMGLALAIIASSRKPSFMPQAQNPMPLPGNCFSGNTSQRLESSGLLTWRASPFCLIIYFSWARSRASLNPCGITISRKTNSTLFNYSRNSSGEKKKETQSQRTCVLVLVF